jgi:ribosomal protein S18 acetylase RimI-like enzyme
MAGFDGHRGWVNYLAVSPEHRNAGLGRTLMRHVESALEARGCPKLSLQVRATNKAALEFYKHIGYAADEVVSLGKRLIPDAALPRVTE